MPFRADRVSDHPRAGCKVGHFSYTGSYRSGFLPAALYMLYNLNMSVEVTEAVIPLSEARSRLSEIVRDAGEDGVIISQNGTERAAVIGIDEYRRYVELRNRQMLERIRAKATGEYVDHDDVLREFGVL